MTTWTVVYMQHTETTPKTSLLDVGEHFTRLPTTFPRCKSPPSELLQSGLLQICQGLISTIQYYRGHSTDVLNLLSQFLTYTPSPTIQQF